MGRLEEHRTPEDFEREAWTAAVSEQAKPAAVALLMNFAMAVRGCVLGIVCEPYV